MLILPNRQGLIRDTLRTLEIWEDTAGLKCLVEEGRVGTLLPAFPESLFLTVVFLGSKPYPKYDSNSVNKVVNPPKMIQT